MTMADTHKVLGQVVPPSGSLTSLYTVPGATSTVVSSLVVCNQCSSSVYVRISVAVGGATSDTKQYLYYNVDLAERDTFSAILGLSLGATDVVRCWASASPVSFSLFGVEVT